MANISTVTIPLYEYEDIYRKSCDYDLVKRELQSKEDIVILGRSIYHENHGYISSLTSINGSDITNELIKLIKIQSQEIDRLNNSIQEIGNKKRKFLGIF